MIDPDPETKLKILAWPAPGGSAQWRLHDPFKYLQKIGVDAQVSDEGITEQALQWADVYVFQSCVNKDGIALAYQYQQEQGKKIVVEVDDWFDLNDDNPHDLEWKVSDGKYVIQKTIEIADMVTCTTDYLAEKLRPLNKNVWVLPNYPDLKRWDLPKRTNQSGTIRIMWGGSATHLKDLEMVVPALKKICQEFPQVQLIFVGDTRIAQSLPGLSVETMLGVPFEWWPKKLNELQADIAIAPLRDTEFNRCKSKIKFYEYALAQVPGVYSPTVYNERGFDGNFGMVADDPEHWYRTLKNLILFPQLREDIASAAYAHVSMRCGLEKHSGEWAKAYRTLMV